MLSLPSLDGAEIVDLALQSSTLTLWLENVRWLGVVLAGPLNLEGVCRARSREPRSADDAYDLCAGLTILESRWSSDALHLECVLPTGPGDADTPTFELGFSSVSHALRPSPGRSLRAWVGFYPLPSDRKRRFSGPFSIPISALRSDRDVSR